MSTDNETKPADSSSTEAPAAAPSEASTPQAESKPEDAPATPAAASTSESPSIEVGLASAHGDEEGDEEGEGDEKEEGDAASGAASGEAAPGEAPKKKRRRRRRKKKPEGAEGATASAEGEGGEAAAEGQEGEGGAHPASKGERKKPDAREAMPFRIGEEVFGKVEKVTDDAIWIDVAGKALGLFDRREIGDGEPPQPGDQFIATVASHGLRGGMLRMARAPFPIDDAKKKVESAKDSGETVEGFVTGAVKGGVEVDIDGLRAFAPASHVEIRQGADLSALVGRRLNFNVVQFEKKGRDVVVSRKKFLQEEAQQARAEALKILAPGTTHKGIVRTVVQWGVFVALPDAGNLEGLVHATEASHDRTAKLADLFKPGDPIEVKVLKIDDKGKIWLSRKAMTNDPWDAVSQKYAPGTRHTGKVVRIQPFGAFIELEPGIDGLAYTQDLSLKPIQNPKDMLKVDESIEVVVANCDSASRRISLHPAPPEDEANEPRPKVGPNRIVKVSVVHPGEPGLLVRIIGLTGRAARGFIPAGHTGTQRGTDLRKSFPVGMKFDAKVIEVDTRRGETKLSIRAMKEDAEKAAYQEYRDQVNREAKFGTFADLMKK
ncbi:MAG: S1 RNA-binding domain-containing protein [Polyangiaceae bacterium]|nr:S1 RNA-binding domain-containing protein [Polyangiaceae bacterium]